jgi:hypothetical protein
MIAWIMTLQLGKDMLGIVTAATGSTIAIMVGIRMAMATVQFGTATTVPGSAPIAF